ncbi:MAG TPA: hypothetical protein VGT07_08355 [Steroidobacteraceae bacterium]|nr:hypothetical protein [Steroidobacteraceae bacterium]
MFNSLASAMVAVAFWIFLGAAAVAGMRYDFRKRQLAMESLRAAIEHGQSLDPSLVDKLLARDAASEADDPQELAPYLKIGGIITTAGGIGLFIAGFFVGLQFPIAKLPMLGAGVLVGCIGVGLLLAARAIGGYPPRPHSPDTTA